MKSITTFIFLFISITHFSQSKNLSEKFENNEFKVHFPEGWRIDTESLFHTLVLYPPSIGDEYETSVNFFLIEEETPIIDLEAYSIQEQKMLAIRTDVQSNKIIDSQNGKCIRYEYTMDFYGSKLIGIQYRFIKGATVYSLSFSGEEKSYHYYKNIAEEVMKSFSFK
ncbi:hypothetical protein [Flavobacterium sp.]|uniref:hypothetical protein n=1 Tax=Flavobacterium sp. TaxID=239 RepID=UPI0040486A3F